MELPKRSWVGGGGAHLKNRDQIFNVWIICHGTSETFPGWGCVRTRPIPPAYGPGSCLSTLVLKLLVEGT